MCAKATVLLLVGSLLWGENPTKFSAESVPCPAETFPSVPENNPSRAELLSGPTRVLLEAKLLETKEAIDAAWDTLPCVVAALRTGANIFASAAEALPRAPQVKTLALGRETFFYAAQELPSEREAGPPFGIRVSGTEAGASSSEGGEQEPRRSEEKTAVPPLKTPCLDAECEVLTEKRGWLHGTVDAATDQNFLVLKSGDHRLAVRRFIPWRQVIRVKQGSANFSRAQFQNMLPAGTNHRGLNRQASGEDPQVPESPLRRSDLTASEPTEGEGFITHGSQRIVIIRSPLKPEVIPAGEAAGSLPPTPQAERGSPEAWATEPEPTAPGIDRCDTQAEVPRAGFAGERRSEKPPGRIATLHVEAQVAHWDEDVEPDGLLLELHPLDLAGNAVAIRGTVEVELIGYLAAVAEWRRGPMQLGHWVRIIQSEGSAGFTRLELPFQVIHPEFDRDWAPYAAVHVRLVVPGIGAFEATDPNVRIRQASPVRDAFYRATGRRFAPGELTNHPSR